MAAQTVVDIKWRGENGKKTTLCLWSMKIGSPQDEYKKVTRMTFVDISALCAYFDITNRLGVTPECDRKMDKHCCSKCHA